MRIVCVIVFVRNKRILMTISWVLSMILCTVIKTASSSTLFWAHNIYDVALNSAKCFQINIFYTNRILRKVSFFIALNAVDYKFFFLVDTIEKLTNLFRMPSNLFYSRNRKTYLSTDETSKIINNKKEFCEKMVKYWKYIL